MKKIMQFIIDNVGTIIFGTIIGSIVIAYSYFLLSFLSHSAQLTNQCYNACYPNIVLESNTDFCVCAPEKIIWRKDIK
jgi:hypothetical protein